MFLGKVEVYFHKVSIIKTIAESIKILLSGKVERKLADSIDFEISKTLGESKFTF